MCGIEVGFDCPGKHGLSTWLHDRVQFHEIAVNGGPGLLQELPLRRLQRIFSSVEFSLGQGPRPRILLGPQGATGMNQEDLDAISSAIQQQTGALFCRHGVTGLSALGFRLWAWSLVSSLWSCIFADYQALGDPVREVLVLAICFACPLGRFTLDGFTRALCVVSAMPGMLSA